MNQSQLFRLRRIFREIFDDPSLEISSEFSQENCSEWDSVASVQLVLAVEQEFGMRFSTESVAGIKSVADLQRLLPN